MIMTAAQRVLTNLRDLKALRANPPPSPRRRYSRSERWTKREVMYVGYVGELFLRALKALIIPLIVSSLVSAIGESLSSTSPSSLSLSSPRGSGNFPFLLLLFSFPRAFPSSLL